MVKSYTIITGGLGGLGSAFALEYARLGRNIILIDVHPAGGELIKYLYEQYHVEILYYQSDLSLQTEREELFKEFYEKNFLFNGLINIVGQEIEGRFLDLNRNEILNLLHLNIEAMLDLTYTSMTQRDTKQRFSVINVASLAGFFPMPHKALYAASKRFIINFSLGLREEIRDFGNVIVLCPAGLPTTAESMKKIFIQGFWGRLTAQDTDVVVRKTIKKVERHVPIYIPGFPNTIMVLLARFFPEPWLAHYLANRWGKRQEQLNLWRMVERQRDQKA